MIIYSVLDLLNRLLTVIACLPVKVTACLLAAAAASLASSLGVATSTFRGSWLCRNACCALHSCTRMLTPSTTASLIVLVPVQQAGAVLSGGNFGWKASGAFRDTVRDLGIIS